MLRSSLALLLLIPVGSLLAGEPLQVGKARVQAEANDGEDDEEGFMSMHPKGEELPWEKGVQRTKEGYLDGGGRYLKRQFGDFVLRFEFRQQPGANSGIGIRAGRTGNVAYDGMEIQVLEDSHPKYAKLQPYQYHGSIYGVVPAKRGSLKKPGEWNTEEIRAEGDRIKVTVNGVVIVDADIRKASKAGKNGGTIDGNAHPGLLREQGYITIAGHGGGVAFRNMRIKTLNEEDGAAAGAGETTAEQKGTGQE